MLEFLLRPTSLALATAIFIYLTYALRQLIWPSHLPRLPVVGSSKSDWLPLLQARWRNTKKYKDVAAEIETVYKDKPCIVPIGGSETVVLLPASETQHIVDQPDSLLNMPQPMIDGLQFKYTVRDQIVLDEPLHLKTVSKDLTREISNLVPDIVEEAAWGFDKHWGNNISEFVEVPVFDTMRHIIGSVSNRVFVGMPTGRNPKLVEAGMSYAAALPQEAGKLRMYPSFLKPLIARRYTEKTRKHTKDFYDILVPEVAQRLEEHRQREQGVDDEKRPRRNDYLEWAIPQAKVHVNPKNAEPETIAGRVLMLNFGAIHTTSFTITHAIFDLFSSSQETVNELRREVSSVLAQHGGEWNKRSLQDMHKLDSLVREALRLNMSSTFGVPRLVIGREGFVTRSGIRIPRGNTIAVPGKNIGRDEAFYEDANTFKPFRFAEKRQDGDVEYVQRARLAAATTNPEFLPFGHGKHACPGRFFAVGQLKLILGYMIMNYEIEMLDKRPSDIFIGVAKLPPLASKIRIRRRDGTIGQ